MAWGRSNLGGRMSATRSVVIVSAPTGSTVTMTDGAITRQAPERNGVWTFTAVKPGLWTIKATKGPQMAERTVDTNTPNFYRVSVSYRSVPRFTYTGQYSLVDDSGHEFNQETYTGNWNLRLLTSGLLTFTDGAPAKPVDLFAVGGGGGGPSSPYGGGGGGGYASCKKSTNIGESSNIAIGPGGAGSSGTAGGNGGETTGFGITADGGLGGAYDHGGNGSNGGGGFNGRGGEGGSGGIKPAGNKPGGSYADYITREFFDPFLSYFGGGGGGSGGTYLFGGGRGGGGNGGWSGAAATSGQPNTGGGGGANSPDYWKNASGGDGGSGVFIIRNARGG